MKTIGAKFKTSKRRAVLCRLGEKTLQKEVVGAQNWQGFSLPDQIHGQKRPIMGC